MNDIELAILQALKKTSLASKPDLISSVSGEPTTVESCLNKLIHDGYVTKVEGLGTCFVITQKGSRQVRN